MSHSDYQAFVSRDRRFDGRLYIAVKTTGIYCRPICPARPPKPQNVEFYSCAAAAEAAGYRACLRCRPESAPGTPAWNGTSASVSRALRMIEDGGLDRDDVQTFASKLGMSERHLRRLFDEHLGASPVAVAQTRRLHFARRLLDETRWPMVRVAECAGFSSVRRFNSAIREAFGRSPTELRRDGPKSPSRSSSKSMPKTSALTLKLSYRTPFDWNQFVEFFRDRAVPSVERLDGDTYQRTFAIDDDLGTLSVRPDSKEGSLVVSLDLLHGKRLLSIVHRVRRVFDLDADPSAIADVLKEDKRLKKILSKAPGLRVPGAFDPFELAVRAILGQQVSVKGARTLASRIVQRCGRPLPTEAQRDGLTQIFPEPTDLVDADLSGLGITGSRIETLQRVSKAVLDGHICFEASFSVEEFVAQLTAIKGIGPWTAHYIAMRGLSLPDAFIDGDLGLRKAWERVGGDQDLRKAAESWRPWRAYAAIYLWQSLST